MEINDLPTDVFLVILNEIFPKPKMDNIVEVKKIIKIGTISRHFRRVENLFWRQIVTRNNLFRSKRNSTLYKTNPKLMHVTRYFGCHNCQQLTRLQCADCEGLLCLECYQYDASPECGCEISSLDVLCRFCIPTCSCGIRVCGNCTEECGNCGRYCCAKCCSEEKKCCACIRETCVHELNLIGCECKGEKYACLDRCFLQEIQCVQCSKAICNDCGNRCQNCEHWACSKCIKISDSWYTCVNKCEGSGVQYSTCQQCQKEFAFADKDTDVGHCGNCEHQICKNCIDTCQKCHRKLCLTCIRFHEPNCIGLVACQKCQMIVSSENYTVCYRCDRETGCNKCCRKCRRCKQPHCDSCLPHQYPRHPLSLDKEEFVYCCQRCHLELIEDGYYP